MKSVIKGSLKNRKVLLTCGPTWTALDLVRVLSNISSGELGHTIASELVREGARVTMLEGPVTHAFHSPSVRVVKFRYFDDFARLFEKEVYRGYHIIIHAAAVSDYQPQNTYGTKIGSHFAQIKLNLIPTPKLINKVKKIRPKSFLVGFKLEVHKDKKLLLTKVSQLFAAANCDLIVANFQVDKEYASYIVDRKENILSEAKTRRETAKNLIQALIEKL